MPNTFLFYVLLLLFFAKYSIYLTSALQFYIMNHMHLLFLILNYVTAWTNMKITKELEDRQRFDEIQFQKSGRGPVPKTYKFDPTRQSRDAVAAKKRDPK
jgi:hypothetical protein